MLGSTSTEETAPFDETFPTKANSPKFSGAIEPGGMQAVIVALITGPQVSTYFFPSGLAKANFPALTRDEKSSA